MALEIKQIDFFIEITISPQILLETMISAGENSGSISLERSDSGDSLQDRTISSDTAIPNVTACLYYSRVSDSVAELIHSRDLKSLLSLYGKPQAYESRDYIRKHIVVDALYSRYEELTKLISKLERECVARQDDFDAACCDVAELKSKKKCLETECKMLSSRIDTLVCELDGVCAMLRQHELACSCYNENIDAQIELNKLKRTTDEYKELLEAKNLSEYYIHFKDDLMLYKLSYEHLNDIVSQMKHEQELKLNEIEEMRLNALSTCEQMLNRTTARCQEMSAEMDSHIAEREDEADKLIKSKIEACEEEIRDRKQALDDEFKQLRIHARLSIEEYKKTKLLEFDNALASRRTLFDVEIADLRSSLIAELESKMIECDKREEETRQIVYRTEDELKRIISSRDEDITRMQLYNETLSRELEAKEKTLASRLAGIEAREKELLQNKDRINNYPKLKNELNKTKHDYEQLKRENEKLREENRKLSISVETFINFKRT